MSHHKHIFDRAFNRHHHLNRAAAAVDEEDPRAAKESAAAAAASSRAAAVAAASSRAAAVAAAAASSKEAAKASETIPAAFTTPLTLPGGQILPVPHGPTPEAITEPEPAPSAVRETPSSVVSVPHTSSPLVSVTTGAQNFTPTTSSVNPVQDSSSTPTSVSSSKKLSSGATGAIVAIVVLLFAIVGTVVVRKFYMRRRSMKRNTWGAGLVPALENKRSTVYGEQSSVVSEPKSLMSQTTATSTTIPTPTSVNLPSPPSLSYIPSAPTSIAPVMSPNVVVTNTGVSSPSMPAAATEFAVVVRTFVPTLPDELHISNGEHIRLISSFDDGWALCSNVRGDQGVVPLECLHRETFSTQMQLQPESEFGYDSNKAARRLSSLVPSTGATY